MGGLAAAQAQDYPNRLIKVMQGFPPGGNVDIIARLLANEMQKSLGQTMVVEAKPGLAGALAAETVARSDPDGYTLLVLPSAHPAYGALSKNVKYKVVDDFTWISTASFYPFLICVRADSRFQTLKQLLDEARANPGALKYGSAGVGSILHTTVELMGNMTKTKFLHVPYRGEAPAITGLLHRRLRFHRRDQRADQRARALRRVPRAGGDRPHPLARLPRCADHRGGGHSGLRGHLLDRPGRPGQPAEADRRAPERRGAPGARGARASRASSKRWAAIRAPPRPTR